MTIDNSFMCVKGNISISDSNNQRHLGVVSASAFLCFSGIYICHRDSETQKCGIPNEKRKIRTEKLPFFAQYLATGISNEQLIHTAA